MKITNRIRCVVRRKPVNAIVKREEAKKIGEKKCQQ
jgi:hypothetical protein